MGYEVARAEREARAVAYIDFYKGRGACLFT